MRDTARSSIAPFQRNETSALVSIDLNIYDTLKWLSAVAA
jgi:hypothetical protein